MLVVATQTQNVSKLNFYILQLHCVVRVFISYVQLKAQLKSTQTQFKSIHRIFANSSRYRYLLECLQTQNVTSCSCVGREYSSKVVAPIPITMFFSGNSAPWRKAVYCLSAQRETENMQTVLCLSGKSVFLLNYCSSSFSLSLNSLQSSAPPQRLISISSFLSCVHMYIVQLEAQLNPHKPN